MRTSSFVTVCVCLTLGHAGCGSSNTIWVTCEVSKGGKPFVAPEGQSVQVTFYAIETKDETGKMVSNNQPFPAAPVGEGKYEVVGPDGQGIPPGKYRISVIQTPSGSATATSKSKRKAPDRDQDFLEDRFGPTSSPIVCTVEQSTNLIVDLDRPTEVNSPR